MTKFCGACGSQLGEAQKFCGRCGIGAHPGPVQSAAEPSSMASAARNRRLVGFGAGAVAILLVGGLVSVAALLYLGHKVSQKAHAAARTAVGKSSVGSGLAALAREVQSSEDSQTAGFKGDACRFLSKADVARAVGVPIIRADSVDSGCNYVARGDPADMTSKHMTAMLSSQRAALGQKAVGPQAQKFMQSIIGGFFTQQESSDKDLRRQAATGEVIVLSIWLTSGQAGLEMKANRMAFNHLSQDDAPASMQKKNADRLGTGDVSGIGDDAYEMGGSGLMMRKGNTTARLLFQQCPCNAEAIKPLAAKLADQL